MTETAVDAQERQEWLDALDAVVRHGGVQAGSEIVSSLAQHAENSGVPLPRAIPSNSVPCLVTCLWSGGSDP
jgi:pyruvate dehydrogenase complex dehydrogenase (E1) component